jgi:2-polyprenyl-3-methyl-5-hydroxy-6-metoxy-1,4-benzoquinol methylase
MYEIYVNYALSTNMRGGILAEELSNHISLKNRSYLDIGTAYGGFMVAFSKMGCKDPFGLEIDDRLVNICKLNLTENGLDPESVIRYDICQPLPAQLKNEKFDIITCTDVLEHVLDIPMTINNIIALAADGCDIYLEIPNRYHINNVLSDPHFGLFGITLLERNDAIDYFNMERQGKYLVGDYCNLEYFLSFFPDKYFKVTDISNPTLPDTSDEIFLKEVKDTYLEKVNKLSASSKLKRILIDKFHQYIINYSKQMNRPDMDRFYVQSWKLIIHKIESP